VRRLLTTLVTLLVLGAAPASAASGPASSWVQEQIETVVAAGLMAPSVEEFRPDDPLTKSELGEIVTALGGTPPSAGLDGSAPVKLRELDTSLVRALGLGPAAKHVRSALAAAGLTPRPYVGTEVVARLLGLRVNHPQEEERLELLPEDPASRAEAAYSLARVIVLRASGEAEAVAAQVAAFSAPELSEWQRLVLQRAVGFVGYPYVWGGSSEKPQAPFGKPAPGGFDCSGFVWRVYKLEPFAGGGSLAEVLKGRTTYVMSGEVGPERRISFAAILPADVLFFGSHGPRSKPSQVGHMGIYVGNGWFVHSSGRGTTIARLDGWYATSFAWGRRPLAESGLG
jgi:cell wall-associated NlpC family hydrolase